MRESHQILNTGTVEREKSSHLENVCAVVGLGLQRPAVVVIEKTCRIFRLSVLDRDRACFENASHRDRRRSERWPDELEL